MMGKIRKGRNAGGCIDYVTRKKKDTSDGSPCDEWRLIDYKDVSTLGGKVGIIASFKDNKSMNPNVKNPVGHISLNFHALDMNKINDEIMVEIAAKYMEKMGIIDTLYILVRHLDKDYPHCHLVYSRINNSGKIISDSHDYDRNQEACFVLTKEYGLNIYEGKQHTNVSKLRGVEKIRFMRNSHPLLMTQHALCQVAIPNHSPSSRQDIQNSHPNNSSMYGEPNAEACTSTEASTCNR